MKKFLWLLILLPMFAYADDCNLSVLKVDYDEKVLKTFKQEDRERYVQYFFFDDGDLLIYEHQFCFMDDYQIDYFSKKLDEEKVQARLAEFISSISAKHHLKIKTDFFSPILATGGADHHFYSANSENVEVSRALEKADFRVLPENFSLYIGIGGMH
ncbi:hypothetical protein INR79_16080 [Vibrio sp. SCSIO 43132]|uniref:hypothetical protein n=1 Tax=Vibrio TaxID=662 RepID=UPI001CAA3288|nr:MULTISPECIES: hypothetical protein [Vibrio]UAB70005.1 hypothetical protein INR79_16080 [Vibrio sp. SCSIO 43132]BDU35871.1 hypothetical protein TUMSATVNIG2_03400 [Vibrio nigripulchritudo]BDU41542.1 hypothetical protein TUMSATVNIG3_03400 [Vibrio nigripulchritudo]